METATITIQEYNRLRDNDIKLRHLEMGRVVRLLSTWNGSITTIIDSKDEALLQLTKELQDANFQLEMTRNRLSELQMKQKKWYKWKH